MSRNWLRLTLFWVLLGVARTHHFFRVVVLAALGLAGLWMVHTLALDFNAIQQTQRDPYFERREPDAIQQTQRDPYFEPNKELYKREVGRPPRGPGLDVIYVAEPAPPQGPHGGPRPKTQIDWERVLSRDPVGCARSFLCQLAATDARDADEELMLRLVSAADPSDGGAVEELRNSVRRGEELRSPSACMSAYRYCPYSSRVMMGLIRFFGRSPL